VSKNFSDGCKEMFEMKLYFWAYRCYSYEFGLENVMEILLTGKIICFNVCLGIDGKVCEDDLSYGVSILY
jgi:hypothetical protein